MIVIKALKGGVWHYLHLGADWEPTMLPGLKFAYNFPVEKIAWAVMKYLSQCPEFSGYNMELEVGQPVAAMN